MLGFVYTVRLASASRSNPLLAASDTAGARSTPQVLAVKHESRILRQCWDV